MSKQISTKTTIRNLTAEIKKTFVKKDASLVSAAYGFTTATFVTARVFVLSSPFMSGIMHNP